VALDDDDGVGDPPNVTWLTLEECLEKYDVDPMLVVGQARSKLTLAKRHNLVRVWLESDVSAIAISKKGKP
jgi:hypothetical protein